MKKITASKNLKFIFLAVLFGLITRFPISPLFSPYPRRDSGVFAYIGWRIRNGELPYLNVWDHKPPMVFYLNALGLDIVDNSFWGIWIVGTLSLITAVFFSLKLLSKLFNDEVSIATTGIWLGCLPLLYASGNHVTEYSLSFQFASLYGAFLWLGDQKKTFWKFFLIGTMGGLAFMTKQSAIGVWVAIGAILLIQLFDKQRRKSAFIKLSGLTVGVLFIIASFVLFFELKGALNVFWDQAFLYNFKYIRRSNSGILKRIINLIRMKEIDKTTVFHLGIIGGFAAIARLLSNKRIKNNQETNLFIGMALINLIIEVLLTHLPDNTFEHYFITLLPVLAVFSGFVISIILGSKSIFAERAWVKRIFLALVVVFACFPLIERTYSSLRGAPQDVNHQVIKLILEETTENDTVVLWGAESAMNFHTRRRAPTKYVYQYPLIHADYVNEQMINEFLDDILEEKPRLLINKVREDMPFLEFPISNPEIETKVQEILDNYELGEELGGWLVYRLK